MIIFHRPQGQQVSGLENLCKHLVPSTVMVEVGSYTGESAKIFLHSGKVSKLYCVDIWDDNEIEQAFNRRMTLYSDVFKEKSRSVDAARMFKNHSLDFVYIDADHKQESVKNDLVSWLPKIKVEGLIGGHDYMMPDGNCDKVIKDCPGVRLAVNTILGKPDIIFEDGSWLVKL